VKVGDLITMKDNPPGLCSVGIIVATPGSPKAPPTFLLKGRVGISWIDDSDKIEWIEKKWLEVVSEGR
jgi:hypothetical protein